MADSAKVGQVEQKLKCLNEMRKYKKENLYLYLRVGGMTRSSIDIDILCNNKPIEATLDDMAFIVSICRMYDCMDMLCMSGSCCSVAAVNCLYNISRDTIAPIASITDINEYQGLAGFVVPLSVSTKELAEYMEIMYQKVSKYDLKSIVDLFKFVALSINSGAIGNVIALMVVNTVLVQKCVGYLHVSDIGQFERLVYELSLLRSGGCDIDALEDILLSSICLVN